MRNARKAGKRQPKNAHKPEKEWTIARKWAYKRVMSPSKDSVKQWLRDHPDRDGRRWLASLCEVSKRTVDNWLSSPAAIPAKALVIIGRQMEADREAIRSRQPAPDQNLVLEVDPETFDQYNRAALSKGLIVRDWAVDTLNRAAERDVEDSKNLASLARPWSLRASTRRSRLRLKVRAMLARVRLVGLTSRYLKNPCAFNMLHPRFPHHLELFATFRRNYL